MLSFILLISIGCAFSSPLVGQWGRIVGGGLAKADQFPYQVSIRMIDHDDDDRIPFCGGAILNDRWILTAAHCFPGLGLGDFDVMAGSILQSRPGDVYKVASFKVHESYNPTTKWNDIALVKTATPMKMKSSVATIEMGTVGDNAEEVVVSGWGATTQKPNEEEEQQDILKFVTLKTMDLKVCGTKLPPKNPITENQVCTANKVGEGTCAGDSGGPLVKKVNGKAVLVGVVSWGVPCAKSFPDVFTRVSAYSKWIADNTK